MAAATRCRRSNMQEPNSPGRDEALSRTLREWPVAVSLPPRFQEEVWVRIENAGSRAGVGPFAALGRWLENTLPRPKVALAYVAVLLLVGMTAGFWQAKTGNARANTALSSRYV